MSLMQLVSPEKIDTSDVGTSVPKVSARGVNVYYGSKQALFDVGLDTVSYTHLTLPTSALV